MHWLWKVILQYYFAESLLFLGSCCYWYPDFCWPPFCVCCTLRFYQFCWRSAVGGVLLLLTFLRKKTKSVPYFYWSLTYYFFHPICLPSLPFNVTDFDCLSSMRKKREKKQNNKTIYFASKRIDFCFPLQVSHRNRNRTAHTCTTRTFICDYP